MPDKPQGVMVMEQTQNPEVPSKPTLAEAADILSPAEVDLGVKQGAIVAPEKKEEAKKTEEKKPEDKKGEDLSVRLEVQEAFTDPAKEAQLLEGYNKNEKGLYHKMKKENFKRQAAETERDHIAMRSKAQEEKIKKLEEENQTLKTQKPPKAAKGEPKKDIFGNPTEEEEIVEDGKKPVTKEDLEEIERKKSEAKKKEEDDAKDQEAHATKILSILNAQQAEAAEKYDGFDKELELAVAIMKIGDDLTEMFPDKKQASKARKLIVDFVYASRNADKFQEGDYNAADIAHDLASMHPEYGKPDGGGKADPNRNGGLDPKKADKIVNNASKRSSSASLSTGGSKKFVPFEEMTAEQLADLPAHEFAKVPKPIRDKFLRET